VPLSAGQTVGPYRVVEKIGEGGMGEVFRAHDARLKRDAALKVLPASAVGAADRRRRFEREAQVLAALDHPFIARVYGVELDGDEPIIVMEFVDGATLADRLERGPLPIDEAIAIALQLCDGLEAAHERNIVHRDLKPANIKIRPDGTIKILDFGIARVLTPDAAVDTANSPTMLGGSTEAGIILGTAAYMSPEQARGRAVDKRADIWACGCILFEMISGRAVFSGESTTDILADVVKKEPDWTLLPASAPPVIVETLKRCLHKDPKQRIRDIADVRFEMTRPSSAVPASAVSAARSSWTTVAWFAAGAALTAGVMLVSLPRRDGVTAAVPVRTTISLPAKTTLALGRGSSVAVSPDGRLVAFTARADNKTLLYLRALDRFEFTPVAGTEDANNPFFSPDGRWIGFFAGEKLKKVSIDGGAPVLVADVVTARGETWGADDNIYVTPSNNVGVSRVPARGGKLEPYSRIRQGELSHRWPTMLPDGKTMLFSVWNDAGWDVSRIAALRAGSETTTAVVELGGGYPRYVRDTGTAGFLVYARAEGLLAAPFDESSLAMSGQAVPVVDGLLTNSSGGAHFDLSPSGLLAYVPGGFSEEERDLQWVGRDGKAAAPPERIRGLTRTWSLSPDGTRVIRNSGGDIWTDELATRRATRLTSSPESGNYSGAWSRDGQTVIFSRGHASNVELFAVGTDGRNERRLTSMPGAKTASGVSRDGRWLLFQQPDAVTLSDLWIADLTGQTAPRPFLKTPAQESYGVFSNDNQWVAYQSNESGRFEIFVRSFPGGERVIRVSADSGVEPVWSPLGNELFYRGLDGRLMAVPVRGGAAFEVGKPEALFDARGYENRFAVSPDAKQFLLMPLIAAEQSSTQINIIQNFVSELRQRVR
jgi:Tol biopolymer transport system component